MQILPCLFSFPLSLSLSLVSAKKGTGKCAFLGGAMQLIVERWSFSLQNHTAVNNNSDVGREDLM
jgi:hypothetical protein